MKAMKLVSILMVAFGSLSLLAGQHDGTMDAESCNYANKVGRFDLTKPKTEPKTKNQEPQANSKGRQ